MTIGDVYNIDNKDNKDNATQQLWLKYLYSQNKVTVSSIYNMNKIINKSLSQKKYSQIDQIIKDIDVNKMQREYLTELVMGLSSKSDYLPNWHNLVIKTVNLVQNQQNDIGHNKSFHPLSLSLKINKE